MNDLLPAEVRDFYATHSSVTDPGRMANWLARTPTDLAGMHAISSQLVVHYRADGDLAKHGFGDRTGEIDLRYAQDMLTRLHELQGGELGDAREPGRRVLGCCRDFTLLFVALARAHGVPARSRVGFAGYFMPDWWIDHVVAEVWDGAAGRWRLVEAQLADGFVDAATGAGLDLLNVPRDRFLVGAQAWRTARAGEIDPERFVVGPDLGLPFLRSWPYLMHNLVLDLAALAKHEMVLWDTWGVIETVDPPSQQLAERLDGVAARLVDPSARPAEFDRLLAEPGLSIPPVITSISPLTGAARAVRLRDRPEPAPA